MSSKQVCFTGFKSDRGTVKMPILTSKKIHCKYLEQQWRNYHVKYSCETSSVVKEGHWMVLSKCMERFTLIYFGFI